MFGLGFSEILVLGVIALIFLGPEQLPELARTIGRFMNELKRSTDSITEDIKSQVNIDIHEKRKQIRKENETTLHHQADSEAPPQDQMDLFSEENMNKVNAEISVPASAEQSDLKQIDSDSRDSGDKK